MILEKHPPPLGLSGWYGTLESNTVAYDEMVLQALRGLKGVP